MAIATSVAIGPLLERIVATVDALREVAKSLPEDDPNHSRLRNMVAELDALEAEVEDVVDATEALAAMKPGDELIPWEDVEAEMGAA